MQPALVGDIVEPVGPFAIPVVLFVVGLVGYLLLIALSRIRRG